ncbi:hypothetical protein WDV85_15070 [Pseudokineococcus sp. 5B2Z-1]|uniref:hypothetical protein n=1 Tax=Pseudokineococcus sp. 5B2Z-1 TaxID=3132744 RepID=UPI0030A35A6F
MLVATALVGVAVGLGAGLGIGLGGGDGASAQPSAGATAPAGTSADGALTDEERVAQRAAELREESAARDADAFDALVVEVEQVVADLSPVVEGAAEHAREGAGPPSPEEAAQWVVTVDAVSAARGDRTSAGTDVNLVGTSVDAALLSLEASTDAFAQAAALAERGDDPTGTQRTAVGALRSGVVAWSVGATQLDASSVERGLGHLHAYLPGVPGSGAITADDEAEGEAHQDGDAEHDHDDEGEQ